ncbi:hypothetical protein Rsub_05769 [Raphidocelis subcapitata]|uniref:MARVEL domain-containing protein n=1 Tax=Raphidocelis subcapitata TaxID=307507 RepID=A0A2V0P500_9CHLO|nr:hypothetical protein Rsub_05769 [Raphidocelis subcapitata]|eukprot:GBF92933.1 hypothetical protein Rsub_05769 [Raphidocelis subcapitata]
MQLWLRIGQVVFLFLLMAASARVVDVSGLSLHTGAAAIGVATGLVGIALTILFMHSSKSYRLEYALPGMSDVLFSSLWALLCAGIFVWLVAQGSCAALTFDPDSVPKFSNLPALNGPAGMGSAGMRDTAARDANRAGALRARTASRMVAGPGGADATLGSAGLSGLGPNVLSGDGYALGATPGLPAVSFGAPGLAPASALPPPAAYGAPGGPMPSRNSKLPTGGDGGLGPGPSMAGPGAAAPMPVGYGVPQQPYAPQPQPQPYQQPFYGQPAPGQYMGQPQQPGPQYGMPGQPYAAPSGQQLFFGGQGAYPQAPYGYPPQVMAPENAAAAARPVVGPFPGTSFAGAGYPRGPAPGPAAGQYGRRRLLAARMDGGERGVCGAYNMLLACAAANLLMFVATALLAGADMARGKGWLGTDGKVRRMPPRPLPPITSALVTGASAVAAAEAAAAAGDGGKGGLDGGGHGGGHGGGASDSSSPLAVVRAEETGRGYVPLAVARLELVPPASAAEPRVPRLSSSPQGRRVSVAEVVAAVEQQQEQRHERRVSVTQAPAAAAGGGPAPVLLRAPVALLQAQLAAAAPASQQLLTAPAAMQSFGGAPPTLAPLTEAAVPAPAAPRAAAAAKPTPQQALAAAAAAPAPPPPARVSAAVQTAALVPAPPAQAAPLASHALKAPGADYDARKPHPYEGRAFDASRIKRQW